MRVGTFPTLAALECCSGGRCAAFQARTACRLLCVDGRPLGVKYYLEGWLAAVNAAALRERNRSLVGCEAGLCLEPRFEAPDWGVRHGGVRLVKQPPEDWFAALQHEQEERGRAVSSGMEIMARARSRLCEERGVSGSVRL